MQYLGGFHKGESYFANLKQAGLVITPTNGPTIQALTAGQIKLALVQSSAAVGAKLDDPKLRVKYLNPQTLLPGAIGIDARSSQFVPLVGHGLPVVLSRYPPAVRMGIALPCTWRTTL